MISIKTAIACTVFAAAFAASISGAAVAEEKKQDQDQTGAPPPSDVAAPAENGSADGIIGGRPIVGADGWLFSDAVTP